MDAASAAVGIVSLSLQVCQGLVVYCDGFKDCTTDIQETKDSVKALENILEDIASLLQDDGVASAHKEIVGSCLKSCARGLQSLQKSTNTFESKSRISAFARRLSYPIRGKRGFMNLRIRVDQLRNELQIALIAFGIRDCRQMHSDTVGMLTQVGNRLMTTACRAGHGHRQASVAFPALSSVASPAASTLVEQLGVGTTLQFTTQLSQQDVSKVCAFLNTLGHNNVHAVSIKEAMSLTASATVFVTGLCCLVHLACDWTATTLRIINFVKIFERPYHQRPYHERPSKELDDWFDHLETALEVFVRYFETHLELEGIMWAQIRPYEQQIRASRDRYLDLRNATKTQRLASFKNSQPQTKVEHDQLLDELQLFRKRFRHVLEVFRSVGQVAQIRPCVARRSLDLEVAGLNRTALKLSSSLFIIRRYVRFVIRQTQEVKTLKTAS